MSAGRFAALRRASALAGAVCLAGGAWAGRVEAQAQDAAPAAGPSQTLGFEIKGGYRDSGQTKIESPFQFPPIFLPPGESKGFMETVDEGGHAELQVVTLFYRGEWANGLGAKVKLDLIDRYDRNPTSGDREWDVDEAWLRWGPETEPGKVHEGKTAYAKLGKFPKFERQDDRHLESYGLVGTAFNRMEDIGLETGFDLGAHFYMKSSLTQGNPLFIRDANALAGDNGIDILDIPGGAAHFPDPELKSGIPILYDADSDHLDFDNPEVGLGLGLRFNDPDGRWDLDVLAWGYARTLADGVDLEGTFYGGDLEILRGPFNAFAPASLAGDEKQEVGANVWLYAGRFTFFGQYVASEVANLERTGWEAEVHYDFEMPYLELFGQQVLSFVAPAARFSRLDPKFTPNQFYPSPSISWDWEKVDLGVRMGLIAGLDLTLERNDNEFVTKRGKRTQDEYLATFRYNWSRGR
jgi:hypothetical protein